MTIAILPALIMSLESKNAVVLEVIKKGKRNWLGHWLRTKKELPAERCSRRNGRQEDGSRQQKISYNSKHHDKWTVCRYKKEG